MMTKIGERTYDIGCLVLSSVTSDNSLCNTSTWQQIGLHVFIFFVEWGFREWVEETTADQWG